MSERATTRRPRRAAAQEGPATPSPDAGPPGRPIAGDGPIAGERPRLSRGGFIARAIVALTIAAAVFIIPIFIEPFQANFATRAAIFAIIGLSMNILLGYAGQISLGHQAFVGVGAFISGNMASEVGLSFWLALPIAAIGGAISAALLGLVALRLKGLYLALITLAYGRVAEASIFNIRALTGGGEGVQAPRPAGFTTDHGFLYLCVLFLALVLFLDWRLTKSKAGRAIIALRHDERVAATLGVNTTFYKILAFSLSGFIAGLAGSLFAHWQQVVVADDFVLSIAFTWVFMTVVGGLGSKAGVVIGSIFFGVFPFLFEPLLTKILDLWMAAERAHEIAAQSVRLEPVVGALLLVLTLILYPGGIGQQLLPLRRWLSGGRFLEHRGKRERFVDHRDADEGGGAGADATAALPSAAAETGPGPEDATAERSPAKRSRTRSKAPGAAAKAAPSKTTGTRRSKKEGS
ncbi:MAG TPA: branched-chain amino acid ABC transporter permease [Actinomycetota bacterium]